MRGVKLLSFFASSIICSNIDKSKNCNGFATALLGDLARGELAMGDDATNDDAGDDAIGVGDMLIGVDVCVVGIGTGIEVVGVGVGVEVVLASD
jgi:hypothetical protein